MAAISVVSSCGTATMLTVRETAELLGYSTTQIRRLCRSTNFPQPVQRIKKGKMLFHRAELLAWQTRQQQQKSEPAYVRPARKKSRSATLPVALPDYWRDAMR